jgi:short-subunit dehydrogenase
MRGFALALREDLDGTGVGVTTVFPGFIRDAGMFHDSGAKLPFYIGTKKASHVARAVVRGVERERLEIDVAPFGLRVSARFAGMAPGLVGAAQRRFGGRGISEQIAAGHVDKR